MNCRLILVFAAVFSFASFPIVANDLLPFRKAQRIEPNIENVVLLPQHHQDMSFYYDVSNFRVYFSYEELADVICQIGGPWGDEMTRRLELHRNVKRLIDFRELLYPMRRGEAMTSNLGEMIVGYLIQTQAAAIRNSLIGNEVFLETAIVIRKTMPFDRRLFLTKKGEEILVIAGPRS